MSAAVLTLLRLRNPSCRSAVPAAGSSWPICRISQSSPASWRKLTAVNQWSASTGVSLSAQRTAVVLP